MRKSQQNRPTNGHRQNGHWLSSQKQPDVLVALDQLYGALVGHSLGGDRVDLDQFVSDAQPSVHVRRASVGDLEHEQFLAELEPSADREAEAARAPLQLHREVLLRSLRLQRQCQSRTAPAHRSNVTNELSIQTGPGTTHAVAKISVE